MNKGHKDLNRMSWQVAIVDLSLIHQKFSHSIHRFICVSCSIVLHKITIRLFVFTKLTKKYLQLILRKDRNVLFRQINLLYYSPNTN